MDVGLIRTRWAAIGAAVAVSLGAGGIGLISAAPLSSGERPVLVPVNCRLADTRPAPDNVGPKSSPLGPGETHTFAAHGPNGNCTIPADATALSLNVTALNVTAPLTFLTLWNADGTQPTTSSLNPAAGQPPTPNAVTVDLSASGQFKVFNALGLVDVLVDVTGYYQDHDHDDRYHQGRDRGRHRRVERGGHRNRDHVACVADRAAPVLRGVDHDAGSWSAADLQVRHHEHRLLGGGALYFVTVDGVPLRSSVVYVGDGSSWSGQITGTTEAVIPAGAHTIGLGGQCFTPANVTGFASTTVISSSTVTVLP